jgi:hypothetical protein
MERAGRNPGGGDVERGGSNRPSQAATLAAMELHLTPETEPHAKPPRREAEPT